MDGFDLVALERPGFLSRLFRRRPKENALREVQNLLAQRAVGELSAADVENVLSSYQLSRAEAGETFRQFYRSAVDYRVARDRRLSDADVADLRHLRYVLGLDDADAKDIELEVLRDLYRGVLRHALLDGALAEAEKTALEAMAVNFGLPETTRKSIYAEEVLAVVQEAFNKAVADRRLTDEEEERLARMSENLGVKITHDAESLAKVARFRLLAQIESGTLPVLDCRIRLQRGEQCHAQFPCSLHELRTVTRAVRYHGPSGSIRIMKGLSYRYGQVNVSRIKTEELRQLDSGTLLITSRRLLFNGTNKNSQVLLKRVIHFDVYRDGLRIEKDSGRDQIYKGEGDTELIGLILESALRIGR